MRQGVANLYRPNNRTALLILSLGLGTFLILTVYIVQRSLLNQLSGSIVVSLDAVARAMKHAAERAHVIAEGAAGCAIAAALGDKAGAGKIVAVVSGGNIDLAKFASLVDACDS